MRNTKVIPLAVLSTLAALLILIAWHQEISFTPVLLSFGRADTSTKSTKPPSDGFVKTSAEFKHLGYLKHVYTRSGYGGASKNSVLIASSIANENSFGKGRTFKDFLDVIESLDYHKSSLNLALYCGSPALLRMVKDYFDAVTSDASCPYNQVTVLYAPFLQSVFKSSEHNPKVQRLRRRSIAKGRNFVLLNSLESEQYTLFLDADIIRFDHTDMLTRFVRSGKDIVVPRIERGGSLDYDRNSWRGQRVTPSDKQLQLMDEDKWDDAAFVPHDVEAGMYHLGHQAEEVKDLPMSDERRDMSYSVELDSVGGAVLFSKSIIYKQGIVFPTMNIVGTAWLRKEGYDGIETEGLCYMAQTLGYKCFAMPNLVAQHFDR
ncbi:hypothetical protein HF325_001726 [Metschnikowia pulcherrima]|uniref:Uncharacterized protein n=1 Tax=Metschnikowia pulcherrima TaxID=27326 RepID=A0A8H7GVM1_9ASCO|nr:hypothetical protein HF325_001726 [Metschnikowia pulcherrima]